MQICPSCGASMVRVHRSAAEKLLYAMAFECKMCARRVGQHRVAIPRSIRFLLSSRTSCVRCGDPAIRRASKRDGVDSLSHHPASRLMGLTGAPLYTCTDCRLQYHDWRKPTTAA